MDRRTQRHNVDEPRIPVERQEEKEEQERRRGETPAREYEA
jgi:hypothetical protein